MDMESGDAVERVNLAVNEAFLPRAMSYDRMVCLVGPNKGLRLLDLATGALSILRTHDPPQGYESTWGVIARATSTGEHKVLAITTSYSYNEWEVCKILTLGLGNGGWRDTGSPPLTLVLHSRETIIDDVAYFLSLYTESKGRYAHQIVVFDFSSEAWRPEASSLQGPVNCCGIGLAELDGHLVASHASSDTSIELWFLTDLNRSLWSKQYTIDMPYNQNPEQPFCQEFLEKPLRVLHDGTIMMLMRVLYLGYPQEEVAVFLRIYNLRTKTFRDGKWVPYCTHFSVFTWSLLHSGQRGPLEHL
ncbi:hypothetical protein ACQ4PT_023229 [Festuca glaucescens]